MHEGACPCIDIGISSRKDRNMLHMFISLPFIERPLKEFLSSWSDLISLPSLTPLKYQQMLL